MPDLWVLLLLSVSSLAWMLWRHLTRFRGSLEAAGVPVDHTSDIRGHDIDYKVSGRGAWAGFGEAVIIKSILVNRYCPVFLPHQLFFLPSAMWQALSSFFFSTFIFEIRFVVVRRVLPAPLRSLLGPLRR